ncbi:hypothetical protein CDIK_3819, partial [Cucumispora dikerogammari]
MEMLYKRNDAEYGKSYTADILIEKTIKDSVTILDITHSTAKNILKTYSLKLTEINLLRDFKATFLLAERILATINRLVFLNSKYTLEKIKACFTLTQDSGFVISI